jgi:hypothetical protein
MSDPFGIVAGAVGIAATFTACVDCFQYVQTGRHLVRDFQTDVVSLQCIWLRLSRWGEGVNVYSDPTLGKPEATILEVQAANEALHQILVLFADAERISKRYTKENRDRTTASKDDPENTSIPLADKIRHLAMRRRQGMSLVKSTSWALYHKAELQSLVEGINGLVDEIERLFPVHRSEELVSQEIAEIDNSESLKLIETAAERVDSTLHHAATEAQTGHSYLNIQVQGKAQNGDTFGVDWRGGAIGGFHTYGAFLVDQDGKAMLGNKYGGKDFWDD